MTDRLREIVATDDPALAELARLVRAVGEVDPRPGAQDRVRRALAERPPGRRRWHTPLVVALVLVIVPVAVAGVHRLVARRAPVPPAIPGAPPGVPQIAPWGDAPPAPAPAPAPMPEAAPAVRGAPAAVRSSPAAAPGAPAPGAATPSVPTTEPRPRPVGPGPGAAAPGAPPRHPAVVVPSGPRLAIEPAARPAPGPDATLIVDAMRRLRRQHDPRAALPELDAYLEQSPDGDLAEEVLALAIEARAALGDAAACSLAERYLERYPQGRFRDAAERTRLQLRDPASQRCPPGTSPAFP